MSASINVLVHPSQHPDSVAKELLRSLRSRRINHKFHYDTYKQAAKWLALHEAHSPARHDAACRGVYEEAFAAVSEDCKSGVDVIGLGCGGGQKEASLLRRLYKKNAEVTRYAPVDVSLPLVLTATGNAAPFLEPEKIQPAVLDLALTRDFASLFPAIKGAQRLCTFFGMIPNFEPGNILPRLAELVRRNDRLLLSANLVPKPAEKGMQRILPQYDNAQTREWLLTFLFDLGFTFTDGTLRFTIENASGLPRFVARFHLRRARAIRVLGKEVKFEHGDVIRLFFSYRYTPALLARTLARHGLAIRNSWIAPSREEGVFLIEKSEG